MGANVRRARWAAELTQEEVAAHGISYRYYQELERGQRNPTLRMLFTIARVLRTTVGALTDTDPKATMVARETLESTKLVAPKRGRKPAVSSYGRVRKKTSRR